MASTHESMWKMRLGCVDQEELLPEFFRSQSWASLQQALVYAEGESPVVRVDV